MRQPNILFLQGDDHSYVFTRFDDFHNRNLKKFDHSGPATLGQESAKGKGGDASQHQSVMVGEVLKALDLRDGQMVLDATAGQGGHSKAILQAADVRLIALDADPAAVEVSRQRLQQFGDRAQVVEGNFRDIKSIIPGRSSEGAPRRDALVDRVLFDLGWNRGQLVSGRGFSFQSNDPLNMSYGEKPVSGFTAADILNTWSEEAIANVLYGYGGERYARRIAKQVVEERAKAPIATTAQFVAIIAASVPAAYRHGRRHFATKSFQALRIAVNDELGSLEKGLRGAWELLAPRGRIAVITFHSREDGLVKKLFAEFAKEGGELVSKKPITPSREEIINNPAARSAKLRAITKI